MVRHPLNEIRDCKLYNRALAEVTTQTARHSSLRLTCIGRRQSPSVVMATDSFGERRSLSRYGRALDDDVHWVNLTSVLEDGLPKVNVTGHSPLFFVTNDPIFFDRRLVTSLGHCGSPAENLVVRQLVTLAVGL